MLFGLFSRKNITQLSDVELLPLIIAGNRKAEGELFIRYSPLILGLCLKYLKNKTDSEDIMMELFAKLPKKIQNSEILNFKNWLFTVVRNECLMELRKKKMDISDIEKALESHEDRNAEEIEEYFTKERQLEKVELSLLKLQDEQRVCIELFFFQNKDYKTISNETNFDLKKVKSLIQNGKRNLKLIMEGIK